jgi:hypothetical protein
MPPLAPPGPVIKVAFEINTGASITAGSRFFLKYSGGTPTAADLTTLASDVEAAWVAHLASVTKSTEALVSVTCTDLSSDTGNEGIWTGTSDGSLAGNELPANACALVNHQIARRYRGGRPRTYLRCGVAAALQTPNEWTATFQGQVLAGWQAFIAQILALTGFGFTLLDDVNVSWFSGNRVFMTPSGRARNIPVPRDTPLVDNITNSSVPIKVSSQRRRLDI